MNKIYHLSISWFYFFHDGSPFDVSQLMVLFFEILNEPPCYVRQCSLFAYLILSSLHEMCLWVLHYISLYALSLHSTFAHLRVPFLCMLGRIRELVLHDIINSNYYNSNKNLFMIINIYSHVSSKYINHYLSEPCLDWPCICVKPFISSSGGWECQVPGNTTTIATATQQQQSLWILLITYIDN